MSERTCEMTGEQCLVGCKDGYCAAKRLTQNIVNSVVGRWAALLMQASLTPVNLSEEDREKFRLQLEQETLESLRVRIR